MRMKVYKMENDSLYEIEKEVTVRIIQEDMESIYSLMLTEKDPIFSMASIPYYALFVQACQHNSSRHRKNRKANVIFNIIFFLIIIACACCIYFFEFN